MKQENWQKVKEVFYSALNRPEADWRAYLDDACSGDAAFRSDVELLLNSYESDYLEEPIWLSDEQESPKIPFLAAGGKFSHYEIVKIIGRGGMGEVYLANDTMLDRRVAIKIVHEGSGLGEKAEKRLLREARAAARLDHPNICSVYEVGETAGRPFIAMQYIEGETLETLIRTNPPKPRDCIEIFLQIATALSEAHANGIVHRDIKPSNIIIDLRKQVKVLDFSLAKRVLIETGDRTMSMLTEIGTVAGTLIYMSPEQARGYEIDNRSDIWSLGIVFYEMLTRRPPFFGATKSDIIVSILQRPVPSLGNFYMDYPKGIDIILARALQKDLKARYSSVTEFANDVRALCSPLSEGSTEWVPTEAVADRRLDPISNGTFLANTGGFDPDTTEFNAVHTAEESFKHFSLRVINAVTATSTIVLLWIVAILSVAGVLWTYWSAKAEQLSFAKEMHKKLTVSALFPSDKRPEGTVLDPSFSPDGKYIAYSLLNDGSSMIYVKSLDAGEPVRLGDGRSFDRTPVWSPDGLRLVFLSDRDGKDGLWTISYLGGTPVFHVAVAGGAKDHALRKWSKDAEHIFSEHLGQLNIIDLNNGQVSDSGFAIKEGAKKIEISPEETKIAYVVNVGSVEQIWLSSLTNSQSRRVSNPNVRSFGPSWFPNESEFAFCSESSGKLQIFVYNTNLDSSDQITFNDYNSRAPMVSPDGLQVKYLPWDRFEND